MALFETGLVPASCQVVPQYAQLAIQHPDWLWCLRLTSFAFLCVQPLPCALHAHCILLETGRSYTLYRVPIFSALATSAMAIFVLAKTVERR